MKKVVAAAVLSFCALSYGPSQVVLAEDTTSHKIEKGDTLWDLSEGYLKDPLLWPKIWKINPEIDNPHEIAPGQVVKIPAAGDKPDTETPPVSAGDMLAKPTPPPEPVATPQPVVEAPSVPLGLKVVRKTLVDVYEDRKEKKLALDAKVYDSGIGIVTKDIPNMGKVLQNAQGWHHAASNAKVEIQAPGATVGQQFGVYRNVGEVESFNYFGESPGYLLADIAIIEVVDVSFDKQHAIVKKAFTELQEGDVLGPLPELPVVAERTSAEGPRPISGKIIATYHLKPMATPPDGIVYLNIGSSSGLVPGDRLHVRSETDDNRMAAEIMILRLTPSTSTAVVNSRSNHDVRRGDIVGPIL